MHSAPIQFEFSSRLLSTCCNKCEAGLPEGDMSTHLKVTGLSPPKSIKLVTKLKKNTWHRHNRQKSSSATREYPNQPDVCNGLCGTIVTRKYFSYEMAINST